MPYTEQGRFKTFDASEYREPVVYCRKCHSGGSLRDIPGGVSCAICGAVAYTPRMAAQVERKPVSVELGADGRKVFRTPCQCYKVTGIKCGKMAEAYAATVMYNPDCRKEVQRIRQQSYNDVRYGSK